MTYRLFLDDERDPPAGEWEVVRSLEAAQALVKASGLPLFISFDHDLGADDAGKPISPEIWIE